jgi:hypothetical protein
MSTSQVKAIPNIFGSKSQKYIYNERNKTKQKHKVKI